MSNPRIRAFVAKAVVTSIRTVFPADANRVLKEVPTSDLTEIDQAGQLSWMSLEPYARLAGATREALTDTQYNRLWSSVSSDLFAFPLLGRSLDITLKVLGREPGSVLRSMDVALRLVTEGMGRFAVAHEAPRSAQLYWPTVPQVLDAHPAFVDSTGRAIVAVMQRLEPDSQFVGYRKDGNAVHFNFAW
jgi:hypothetical protein